MIEEILSVDFWSPIYFNSAINFELWLNSNHQFIMVGNANQYCHICISVIRKVN